MDVPHIFIAEFTARRNSEIDFFSTDAQRRQGRDAHA
jgi:hypothetical protein